MRWWSKSLHHASSTGKIWRWTKVKKSRTTNDMLIRMKQSPPPPPPSSVCFCRRAALISPAVTLLWRITLPLCYTRMRKQEGTMPEWEKGQEKLSALVFTPDTICTWDHLLGLMSYITSAVCSQEVSHLLRLSHALFTYSTAARRRRRCCFTADLLF